VNPPQNGVFCDASFFFASLYPDDTNFEKAGELLARCRDKEVALHTTWDVISETVTLLRYRASYRTAVEFLTAVKPTLSILTFDDSVRLVLRMCL
jgi:predicted nucleic acid-binding protein